MRKIFFVSCGLIFLAGCSLFGMQNKSTGLTDKAPKPLAESTTILPTPRVVAYALFIPIITKDYQTVIDPTVESSTVAAVVNQIEQLPTIFSAHNQVANLVIETSTKRSLLSSSASDNLVARLKDLPVGESVVNLPRGLTTGNYQYVILARLKSITINHNIDKIPDTQLISLIVEANLELEFYLISVPNALLVNKFSVAGHAGRANLILSESQVTNYNFQPLFDDAFKDMLTSITNNLAKHKGG
jgi:hypothetical protein